MDVTIVTLYSDTDPNGLFSDTSLLSDCNLIVFTDKSLFPEKKTLVLKPVDNPFWEAVKLNPFNTSKFIWINSEKKFKEFHLITHLNLSEKIKFIQSSRERIPVTDFVTGTRTGLLKYFENEISLEKNPDMFEIYYGDNEDALVNYHGFQQGEITILRLIINYLSTVEGRALAYPLLKYLKPYFIPLEITMCFYSYLLCNYYISKELDLDILTYFLKTKNPTILKMLYENFHNLRLYTNIQPLMEKLTYSEVTKLPRKEGKIKIGVAIPVIKRDILLLDRCLKSLEKQTRKPDIVALSISEISEVSLKKYDLKILVVTTEKKQNASTNRNRAAALLPSDTDYICFFDADDEMHPKRLEFIEQAVLHFGDDFISHNFLHLLSFQDYEWENSELRCYENALVLANYSYGIMVSPKYKIGNREIAHGHLSVAYKVWQVQKYNETISEAGEDTEYCQRLIMNNYHGTYIENKLSVYHNYRMVDSLLHRANTCRIEGKHQECFNLSMEGLKYSQLSNNNSEHLFYKQLSICSYYINQMQLGLKACDHIILSKIASESDKELAKSNIRFYLKPLVVSRKIELKKVNQQFVSWESFSSELDTSTLELPISTFSYKDGHLSVVQNTFGSYRFVFINNKIQVGLPFLIDDSEENIINYFDEKYLSQ